MEMIASKICHQKIFVSGLRRSPQHSPTMARQKRPLFTYFCEGRSQNNSQSKTCYGCINSHRPQDKPEVDIDGHATNDRRRLAFTAQTWFQDGDLTLLFY